MNNVISGNETTNAGLICNFDVTLGLLKTMVNTMKLYVWVTNPNQIPGDLTILGCGVGLDCTVPTNYNVILKQTTGNYYAANYMNIETITLTQYSTTMVQAKIGNTTNQIKIAADGGVYLRFYLYNTSVNPNTYIQTQLSYFHAVIGKINILKLFSSGYITYI